MRLILALDYCQQSGFMCCQTSCDENIVVYTNDTAYRKYTLPYKSLVSVRFYKLF